MRTSAYKIPTVLIIGAVLVVVVSFSVWSHIASASSPFASGSGTPTDPYLIANCTQLQAINSDDSYLYADYLVTADIDCSATNPFVAIGTYPDYGTSYRPFMGRFDGGGHIISNVTVGNSSTPIQGIFGEVFGASFRNIKLRNIVVTTQAGGGTLVGYALDASIVGITVSSSSVTTIGNTSGGSGGIVGILRRGYAYGLVATSTTVTLSGSYTSGETGHGGLIGALNVSTLDRSYASTTVIADAKGVGGLVGTMFLSTIKDSYASSTVTGYDEVGGIVGAINLGGKKPYSDSYIRSSFSTGSTTATNDHTGGIFGSAYGFFAGSDAEVHILDSYAVGPVSSTTNSGGIGGNGNTGIVLFNTYYYPTGTGQTQCVVNASFGPPECVTNNSSSYYNSSSNAPLTLWDFSNIWRTQTNDRPTLRIYPFTEAPSATSVGTCAALASAIRINPNGWFSLSANIDCAGNTNYLPLNGTTSSYFVGTPRW